MSSSSKQQHNQKEQELGDLESFLYLLSFARPQIVFFVVGLAMLTGASVVAMYAAYELGQLVSVLMSSPEAASQDYRLWVVLGGEGATLLLTYGGRKALTVAALRTLARIRTIMIDKLSRLPIAYYDVTPLGRTVTRFTNDVEALEEFFASSLGKICSSLIMAVAALGAMLATDIVLGGAVLIAIIPAVWLTLWTRTLSREYNRRSSRQNSTLNSVLSEFMQGLTIVRLFGLETWTQDKIDTPISAYVTTNQFYLNKFAYVRPLIGLLSSAPLLLMIILGGYRALIGTMMIGTLVSFVRYYERFGRPLVELSFELTVIQQAFASAERVATFLREPEESDKLGRDGHIHLESIRGEIAFSDVTMSYAEGREALRNVTCHIAAGSSVGIIGPTGSGKSTFVALLLRLYPYQSGSITIDGIPLEDIQRASLRRSIGYVSQDVVIVHGTLRDNLTLEEPHSDEHILEACRETGLLEHMVRRGLTLDTFIAEFGADLSAGERQLIAITRLMLRAPQIVILDEATAHVDEQSEEIVHRAVKRLMQERTTIIVAHRLATLDGCSDIFEINQGRLCRTQRSS
jgi:ATP-binding cassette subfamily B multidrug efflux pump